MALAKGPGVPSWSGIVEIPKAPQGLPQGLERVLRPGPELGLLLGCSESDPRPKAGPISGTNHNLNPNKTLAKGSADDNVTKAL